MMFSGILLWKNTSGTAALDIFAYLCIGEFAALGIAIALGKTFLPQDICDGSEIEYRFGTLAGTVVLTGLLIISDIVLNYHANAAMENLIVFVLGIAPIVLLSRVNGENAKTTLLALCGGLYIIAVCAFLFAAIGWMYGPKIYELYLPLALAYSIVAFECGGKVTALSRYVAERTSRVPEERSLSRSFTLLFLTSLFFCSVLTYTFIDALNPIVWDISWPLIETIDNAELVRDAVTVLYLSEVLGASIGFIAGLVKARHRPIENGAYWTVMKYTIGGLVGMFTICASIPMILLYGIAYVVALAMAVAVLYVALVM